MATNRHEKLSDVWNNTQPLLGEKTNSFQEAYPSVAKLRVEIVETEMMWPKEHRSWVLTEQNFRHAVNCSNPVCHGGGIALGWILHDMVSKKLSRQEVSRRCCGYEGSPKGRRCDRSCLHLFRAEFTIEYKSAETSPSDVQTE